MKMGPRKLLWQMFPVNVVIILLAILAVSWFSTSTFQEFYFADVTADLEARASLLKSGIKELIRGNRQKELRRYCVFAGRESGTRITVILADGRVIADSKENPDIMDNHRNRPEIKKALLGKTGVSKRFSHTLEENLIYVAVPLYNILFHSSSKSKGSAVEAVLRTSVSVSSLDRTLERMRLRIGLVSSGVIVLAALVTLLISRNISRPLEQMTRKAEQFARGDFSSRMGPAAGKAASLEVVKLSASMDRMAHLLDEKIREIETHRNRLETVFSSMVEAVVAIDRQERVMSINTEAARLFGVKKEEVVGRLVHELVRNNRLQQQVTNVLEDGVPVEDEITLPGSFRDRYLQIHIVTLQDMDGGGGGVLLVMNDVSKLKRLEGIRRDFVANVSHELRTPTTSIRGYVETLLDGALDDREEARGFLQIVLHQAVRLSTIIDELLILSRIEEDSNRGNVQLAEGLLRPVILSAVKSCQHKAEKAGVGVVVECGDDLQVMMNHSLLEQALVNLLVNGISYSPEGSSVVIKVSEEENCGGGSQVLICVKDEGCGIADRHLPRLFERFYRIDKARSRNLGGTGLGLAIVKHIVQAHGGHVEVRSEEGAGSEFMIILQK
ncbi:ATP-binding protein [Desulfomarina sp.]